MIKIHFEDNQIKVFRKRKSIGVITYNMNRFHKNKVYVDLHLKEYELEDGKEIFREIQQHFSKPLQSMLYENETDKVYFLKHSGFELKRKCYEYKVQKKDLKILVCSNSKLDIITHLDAEYRYCMENLYDKYQENHKNISPLTATIEEFGRDLPKEVYIQKDNNDIMHYAFVEQNEIAYIGSTNFDLLNQFIVRLLDVIFKEYDSIEFEVDDND
ncbi:MAG: hypothetical protein K2K15_04600, partial [Anaeroplasmataceae bacterium]|nr:hypothetical protein [Anaeroplasmataceae bacterium]